MSHINYFQAVLLALVQGLTEFLPVSSSAHLALIPLLSSWPDQGLAFDSVLHLGSLTAVLLYFREDIYRMGKGFIRSIVTRSLSNESEGRSAWFILFATIPVGLAGLIFKDVVEGRLRTTHVIGLASIFFALLLFVSDRRGSRTKGEADWSFGEAILVGFAQVVALIPGTSRSGITMTAGLMLGYNRKSAARFSFLLSIPVIVLAGAWELKGLVWQTVNAYFLGPLIVGYIVSAFSAYLCIHYFLKFIEKSGMFPFVLYRLLLGIMLVTLV